MLRMLSNIIQLSFCLVVFLSCNNKNGNSQSVSQKELKEPLIEENIRMTQEENRLIDRYIERHKWSMNETGTGLRYMIYEKGSGIKAKNGMQATVEYEIKLMDGTICYSSVESGPRTFLIGKDHVESGIHEGVTLMNVGDKAKFILPSYLAHGLSGDNNKIPPRSSLVVNMHLLRLD